MGALPESNLRVAKGMIKTMMIPEQMNVPEQELLGAASRDNPMGTGGHKSFEQPQANCTGNAPVGQQNFSPVPGSIKSALSVARLMYPELQITDVMRAMTPPIQYSAIRVGPTSACLDMLCFGACKEPKCT